MAEIEVNMGEVAVGKAPDSLNASAIGSCVVITLYDRTRKIGGLAHPMLPSANSGPTRAARPNPKYVDDAIEEMLRRLDALGARREDLEAKLIGGANMFRLLEPGPGQANIARARCRLAQEGIPLVGESTGGWTGRSADFSLASGVVTVKSKF